MNNTWKQIIRNNSRVIRK